MIYQMKSKIIENFGTQSDFAEHLGLSESMVSKIIRGRRKISPEQQKRWARELGCKPSDIFEGVN